MKYSVTASGLVLSALAISQGRAEDVLYSRHLSKRDVNADGNYNISQW